MSLKVKSAESCKFDLVALGECMIRLSPPEHGRIEFAPALEVWVGGGEYNVAYALSRLGLRTGWVGGLNTSPMGADHRQSRPGRRHGHLARRDQEVRRRRQGRPHRAQLHRSRPLEAGVGHALRSRPHGHRRHEAGRRELEEALQRAGRPLAAHGRHLRGPLRRHAQGRGRGGEGRPRGRHDRQLRSQLPLEAVVERRKRSRPPSRSCRTSTA